MKSRLVENLKWDVGEGDVENSKKVKKELVDKAKEKLKLEVKLHELREARWTASEALRKAIFLDEISKIAELRNTVTRLRHQEGDLVAKFDREISGLQDALHKSNFNIRKLIVESLDHFFHSKELEVRWDLKSIDKYWKDRGPGKGIGEYNRYVVKTNDVGVSVVKQEIIEFLKLAGAVTSPTSRENWVCGDAGTLRNFSTDEIFSVVSEFEKKLSAINVESLVEKEIGQGELDFLKRQEAA